MSTYYAPLLPDNIYHIFSRATGNEKLFLQTENYHFFLDKFKKHVSPIADVYAYVLLPNHFHFMVKIKNETDIKEYFITVKKKQWETVLCSEFLMERFSNLLNSYTKAINKTYNRKGSLFMDFLRRVEVNNNSQFGWTIFYIHKNPVHHGISKRIEDWPFSSYYAFLAELPTAVLRNDVLNWFGGKKEFIKFHQQPIDIKKAVIIE